MTAETFQDSIDFPSTARYVRTILARYDFYKRRGPLLVGRGRSVVELNRLASKVTARCSRNTIVLVAGKDAKELSRIQPVN